MKNKFVSAVFLCAVSVGLAACGSCSAQQEEDAPAIGQPDTIRVRFAEVEEAAKLVAAPDAFLNGLSRLDLSLRFPELKEVTKEDYISATANELQAWTDEDKERYLRIVHELNETIRLNGYCFDWPDEVVFVKGTLESEFGAAGYTRNEWVMLNVDACRQATDRQVKELIAHELFHVLTRRSLEFKRKMYDLIGFAVTEQELPFPESLRDFVVHNPDVDRFDSYATFTIDGKQQLCAMTLCFEGMDSPPADFFQSLSASLLVLDEDLRPLQKDGAYVLCPIDEATDFWDKVGRNTDYAIHPEEILADNFSYVLGEVDSSRLKTPELLERIRKQLKEHN